MYNTSPPHVFYFTLLMYIFIDNGIQVVVENNQD